MADISRERSILPELLDRVNEAYAQKSVFFYVKGSGISTRRPVFFPIEAELAAAAYPLHPLKPCHER